MRFRKGSKRAYALWIWVAVALMGFTAEIQAERYDDISPYDRYLYRDIYRPQRLKRVKVSLPLTVGIGLPAFRGNRVNSSLGQNLGLIFGTGIDLWFARHWGFGVGLLYAQKGYTESGGVTSYRLAFFEIPILFKYLLSRGVVLHAGAYMSPLLFSATRTAGSVSQSVTSQFSSDYGATFGVLFRIKAGRSSMLGLNFRYDWGLVDIENDSDVTDTVGTGAFLALLTLDFKL